jgi:HAD superfamily (subfamily IA) hydrolase, TIGR02254
LVRVVLFDLDDTLLDFQRAEAVALRKVLEQLGVEPTEAIVARYSEINARLWELLEEGKRTREQVLVHRFELLFMELGLDICPHQAKGIYENLLGVGHYFVPGAAELLEALHLRYELYLVSNGTAVVQDRRIESAGIARYFKEIFISQRVGYDKPAVEFFEHCFERIEGFSKDEALIIGDSLSSDILGGNNAGIRTCWFNLKGKSGREGIQVDYEISELGQIPALLERI